MNPEEYKRMFEMENTYWYFQGRCSIISGLMAQYMDLTRPGRILDVGCGTGLMLERLEGMGQAPTGLDMHDLSMRFCRMRGVQRLARGDVTHLPFSDSSFDLILALDLIEHVPDDRGLLREFRRVAAPGARLIATVPAHPFLWSEHDEALHHCRRYRYAEFMGLLKEAGFRPLRQSYAIALLFPPIVVYRLVQRMFKRNGGPKTDLVRLPALVNRALIRLLEFEGALLRRINLPMGVTILAIMEPDD